MPNAQIQALVARFASEIETLVRTAAVRAVTEALGSGSPAPADTSAAAPAPRAVRKARTAKRKGRRTAPKPVAAPVARTATPKPAAKPTRARRSTAELDRDVGRLVAYVGSNPGVRAEQARPALEMGSVAWIGTVRRALETKRVVATGNKSATTYSLPAAPVPPIKRVKKN